MEGPSPSSGDRGKTEGKVLEAVKFKASHYIVKPLTAEIFIEKTDKTPGKKLASGNGKNSYGG